MNEAPVVTMACALDVHNLCKGEVRNDDYDKVPCECRCHELVGAVA